MMALGEKKGLFIFLALLALMIVVSLAAYQISGHMGIEKRFTQAVGLGEGEEGEGDGWFVLSLEGNPLLYGMMLGILMIGCYAAFRHFYV
jgi:hypothetical protein